MLQFYEIKIFIFYFNSSIFSMCSLSTRARHLSCRPWSGQIEPKTEINVKWGKSLKDCFLEVNSIPSREPGSSRDASSTLVSRPFDVERTKLRAATIRLDRLDLSRVAAKIYILRIYYIILCAPKNARSSVTWSARSKLAQISIEISSQVRNQGDSKCVGKTLTLG